MSEILAFVSGKGGTGKSTAAVCFAKAFADAGNKVLLVDCACGNKALDLFVGLENSCMSHLFDVLLGREELSMAVLSAGGFAFLPACQTKALSDISDEEFSSFLEKARNDYEFILLDLTGGTEYLHVNKLRMADRLLFVTTPEPQTERALDRLRYLLEQDGPMDGILLFNRKKKRSFGERTAGPLEMTELTGYPVLRVISETSEWEGPSETGVLPDRNADPCAEEFYKAAESLLTNTFLSAEELSEEDTHSANEPEELQKEPQKKGFLSRLAGLFGRSL